MSVLFYFGSRDLNRGGLEPGGSTFVVGEYTRGRNLPAGRQGPFVERVKRAGFYVPHGPQNNNCLMAVIVLLRFSVGFDFA